MKIQSAIFSSVFLVIAFSSTTSAGPPASSASDTKRSANVDHAGNKRVRADDKRMAEEALAPHVGSGRNPSVRQARVDALHTLVAERAQQSPSKETSATLVFRSGLTVSELVTLAQDYELEVMAINVKAPKNDIGVIQSVYIGAVDILKWSGDFETQARKAIGGFRYSYLQRAEKLERVLGDVTEDTKAYRRLASSDMRIYGCEVYGKARDLRDAMAREKIAVIVPDNPDLVQGKVDSYKSIKSEMGYGGIGGEQNY